MNDLLFAIEEKLSLRILYAETSRCTVENNVLYQRKPFIAGNFRGRATQINLDVPQLFCFSGKEETLGHHLQRYSHLDTYGHHTPWIYQGVLRPPYPQLVMTWDTFNYSGVEELMLSIIDG